MPVKIKIEDLSQTYLLRRGEHILALEQIDLQIEENEFITLVGPSGCGKSTLLKSVGGLIRPTQGAVHLDGRILEGPTRDIGMVFQNPALLPWRNILDNVLLPIEILGLDRRTHMRHAYDLLELVGLRGFEKRSPRQLSGGMQQRAAICRALVFRPSVLLMDEPFGALDAMTREELAFELLRIWSEHKTTVIFVTHSITEAVLLADRVVVMTARPARVAEVITVGLPRPRVPGVEYSDAFKPHAERIRELIFRKE